MSTCASLFSRPRLVAALGAGAASAEVVGKVGVDWTGNDIIVDAVPDPEVKGVTCHVTYFDRSIIDRVQERQLVRGSLEQFDRLPPDGTDRDRRHRSVEGRRARSSRPGMSLIWKKLVVNRIYDKTNDTLIYLAHSRELTDGSAKMSISTIPLYGQNVTWKNGKPQ